MKDKERKLYLYQIILNNGNLDPLIDDTHTYKDIAIEITTMLQQSLLVYIDNKLTLTELGLKDLQQTANLLGRNHGEWIEPLINERIEKISINDIYLPPIKIFR